MAALDKRDGKTIWSTKPVVSDSPPHDIDAATYASPSLIEVDGLRLIVGCSSRHTFGVDAESGRLLWKRPIPTRFQVIGITPALCGVGVFVTAPDSPGGKLYRLLVNGSDMRVEEAWTADLDTCHGGVLFLDGLLFGSWYRHYNGWGAVDIRTGETLYRTRELAMGSAIHADGRFYCLSQEGVMALVEADRKGLRIVSRFELAKARRKDAWTHPVILEGRLYLRYHERLQCHDIRAR